MPYGHQSIKHWSNSCESLIYEVLSGIIDNKKQAIENSKWIKKYPLKQLIKS